MVANQNYQKLWTNTTTKTMSTKKLRQKIDDFIEKRGWSLYHSPKNLAMALSVETAELVEIFQWMTETESTNVDAHKHQHIEQEIGDIMIYLTTIASKFDIDPVEAAEKKLVLNETKYPAQL